MAGENHNTLVDVLLVGPKPIGRSYVGGIAILLMAQLKNWELPVSVAHFNTEIWARDIGTTGQFRLSHIVTFFINVVRLAWTLICRRPSIVHIHSSIGLALLKDMLLACEARWCVRCKVVFQIHFAVADSIMLTKSPILRKCQLWLLMACCDRVVFLSRNVISDLASMLPARMAIALRAKASILPNFTEIPANIAKQTRGLPPTRIFFIGNVGQRKGVYDLISAADQMRKSCLTPFRMVFAGPFDSPEVEQDLVSLVSQLGLQDLVSFVGPISGAAKDRFFREADIFTLPSYGEGVPVSLIEAMSYGLPSVVTNVGGIPETVKDGREAISISPGDISALATTLVRLIKAPDLRIRIGQAARSRSQECYSSQAFFLALRELYASLNCLPQLS